MIPDEIDFNADVISVENMIERFKYLQSEEEEELTEEEKEELQTINDVLEEIEDYGGDIEYRGNWYPMNLINYYYFESYIRDEIEDIYDLSNIPHFIEIDWEATACNCRQDYSFVDINGEGYLYR